MTIRVLIIDDSPTMRAILMSRLTAENDIAVITLDIEMPGMNGLDFLEKIMALRPTPVIIVSGATQQGNEVTARALALGAVGILLTGMGSDGAKGLLEMAQVGTFTIAQDEATCTVFGMPRVAISLGAANLVAPIDRIASHALQMAA